MGHNSVYCEECGDEIDVEVYGKCMSLECRIKRDGPIRLQELPCPDCAAMREKLESIREDCAKLADQMYLAEANGKEIAAAIRAKR